MRTAPGSIAVVDVFGILDHRAEQMCGWIDGYDAIATRMQEALSDRDVAGVLVRIDSPGGDVAGLEEAIRAINATRDREGKPVAVYVDELAASAGYWLASGIASAGIFAPPMAQIGSIGVYCPIVDETKALEQEGVAIHLVRDPPGKDAANSMDPVPDVALARTQRMVSDAASRFYAAVSAARGIDVETIRGFNGDVFTEPEAHKLGLVDGVGSFDAALAKLANAIGKQRVAGVNARLGGRTMSKSKIKAVEEMPPVEGSERAKAADVAAACRECEKACADCASATKITTRCASRTTP
jgi:signal peptide peptidase SppA